MDSLEQENRAAENDSANIVFEVANEENRRDLILLMLDIPNQPEHDMSFRVLLELFSQLEFPYTVVVEDHYVDRVYRDSYYFYYSSKHFDYGRFCKRLCIFRGALEGNFYDLSSEALGKRFAGAIVLRPIPGRSVGRTLLDPNCFLASGCCQIRLAKYRLTIYGKRLHVRAFPYSMQDGETTSCAEITILNLLDYYSQTYPEYHYLLPSDISRLAEQNSFERRLPTTGLTYEMISKIFCEAGFYPRLYCTHKMDKLKFQHILHYYIESGIPVALGLKLGEENKHSVICIGHGMPEKEYLGNLRFCATDPESRNAVWVCDTADIVDTCCIMDDNQAPYHLTGMRIERDENGDTLLLGDCEVEYMMVPLYKRMILEAADAYDICLRILASDAFGVKLALDGQAPSPWLRDAGGRFQDSGSKEDPLVIRLFMASSRTFRKKRDEQFQQGNCEVRDLYNETVFPKFVWVCEISAREADDQVLGEIVIDATSSADAKVDSFIIVHYPNRICRRKPEDFAGADASKFEAIRDWQPFARFHGNLSNCCRSQAAVRSGILPERSENLKS